MNAKAVAAVFLLVALASNGALASMVSQQLDNMLIQPFCQRSTVKAIMDACVTVAPDQADNTFCTDRLTVATKGSVSEEQGEINDRFCTFLVLTPGTVVQVNCTLGNGLYDTGDDWLAIYPLQKTALWIERKATSGKTSVNGFFDGGATIVASGVSKMSCQWDVAPDGTDPDANP